MTRQIQYLLLPMAWALIIGSVGSPAMGPIPAAENLEISVTRGSSAAGQLSASDPEGDPLRFFVTTSPVKGTLTLEEDGRFIYTPGTNRRGRDYFGYRVEDPRGDRSEEATVIIRIEKSGD